MKLLTSTTIAADTVALARDGDGWLKTVAVLPIGGHVVVTFDERLHESSRERLPGRPSGITTPDRGYWFWAGDALTRFGEDGLLTAIEPPTLPEGMRVAGCATLTDGYVVALDDQTRARPPRIVCMTAMGSVRWMTELALPSRGDLFGKRVAEHRHLPANWTMMRGGLRLGGSSVAATFLEMPRSGIGFVYSLCLKTGEVRFTTRPGPVGQTAFLPNGSLLVGYQGYGVLRTVQYDVEGVIEGHWPTHGYYLPDAHGLRVLELENRLPSRSNLVRLHPHGQVERGAPLPAYYTSRPLFVEDAMYFVRNGSLHKAKGIRITESIVLPNTAGRYSGTPLLLIDGSILCTSPMHRETKLDRVRLE